MSIVIAVTCDRREKGPKPHSHRTRPARSEVYIKEHLIAALRLQGAQVVLLPPGDSQIISWVLERVDGVVISGGAFDIDPRHYGEERIARIDHIDEARTGVELELARRCMLENKPVLGICGGMQAMAVAAGGSLIQDILTQVPGALDHEQDTDPAEPWHDVQITSNSVHLFGASRFGVNSTHHQAVSDPGDLECIGWAPDGVVEVIAGLKQDFCVGVQWHPELVSGTIFESFCRIVEEIK